MFSLQGAKGWSFEMKSFPFHHSIKLLFLLPSRAKWALTQNQRCQKTDSSHLHSDECTAWGRVGLGNNRKVKSIPLCPLEILRWQNLFVWFWWWYKATGLKMQSLDQQHQHHLGTRLRNANSYPRQTQSETVRMEPRNQSFNMPSRICDVGSGLRTSG